MRCERHTPPLRQSGVERLRHASVILLINGCEGMNTPVEELMPVDEDDDAPVEGDTPPPVDDDDDDDDDDEEGAIAFGGCVGCIGGVVTVIFGYIR
jgi:hypothetical protein